jgi:hypothetical protein
MPGSAVLGTNLVDSLITDVIDGLRDDLNPALGVRQYRVFSVRRTYVGEFGSDVFSDVEAEITPQPLVQAYNIYTGIHYDLEPCGLDEVGFIILREISLTYTEDEISGCSSTDLQDFFLKVTDAHGQATKDRLWVPKAPPYADRIKSMGWTLVLKRASD